jgi:streptogramin lyase
MGPKEQKGRRYVFATLLLIALALIAWVGVAPPPSEGAQGQPKREEPNLLSDTGILTEWPLPPNRGPWQLKWDSLRSLIWFAEGTHSNPPLDQIGALDPATSVLREWGIPSAGGYVHGTALDASFNLWFTEVRLNKIGRLQPDSNTITEWTLDPAGLPHGIAVDDIISDSVRVWFSERDTDKISSLDLATGVYMRHAHPFPGSWPHSVVVAPDHSVWFVETCGNRVGRLESSGSIDTWKFWQPPTQGGLCTPPNNIGPLFGNFVNGDFWYSEPYNGRIIRLRPSENSFSIWNVTGASGGTRLITQPAGDPDGNIYFPEMTGNRIGRLEPVGPTTPTVVVVVPTTVSQPLPAEATAQPVSVVYTPIVTQLTPVPRTLTGTRNGSIVEWALPTIPPTPGRRIGPGRAWYGGGAFWVSELTADKIGRFVPYTSTPGTSTPSTTTTATASFTPTGTATSSATGTPTTAPPTNTPTPTITATTTGTSIPPTSTAVLPSTTPTTQASNTPVRATDTPIVETNTPTGTAIAATPSPTACTLRFADVQPSSTFYTYVRCLSCRGVISGYPCGGEGEPCEEQNSPYFRPNNDITRGQIAKIVSNAAGFDEDPGAQIFEDVPESSTFYAWINRLSRRGYMGGYPCGTLPEEPCILPDERPYFRPGANATRGQLAKIVANAANLGGAPTGTFYADVLEDNPFYVWIMRLTELGAMGGYDCGGEGEPCDPDNRPYFRPYNNVTRGQASKIVANTFFPGCQTPERGRQSQVTHQATSVYYCEIEGYVEDLK